MRNLKELKDFWIGKMFIPIVSVEFKRVTEEIPFWDGQRVLRVTERPKAPGWAAGAFRVSN